MRASSSHVKIVFIRDDLSNTKRAGTKIIGRFAVLTCESDDNSERPIILEEKNFFLKSSGRRGKTCFSSRMVKIGNPDREKIKLVP